MKKLCIRLFIACALTPTGALMGSQNISKEAMAFSNIFEQATPNPEPVEINYPQDVYKWYDFINRLPVALQRIFIQCRAAEIEPSVTMRRDGTYHSASKMVLSKDSRDLVYAMGGEVFLLNLNTLENFCLLTVYDDVETMNFSPDGNSLALVGNEFHVLTKDEASGTFLENHNPQLKRGTNIFGETPLERIGIRCKSVFFTSERDIIVIDTHRRIFHYNLEKNVTVVLYQPPSKHSAAASCENRIAFGKINDNGEVIMVLLKPSVQKFIPEEGGWRILCDESDLSQVKIAPFSEGFDLKDNWLIADNTLINLDSKESKRLVDFEVEGAKFSSDDRYIFLRSNHSSNGSIFAKKTGNVIGLCPGEKAILGKSTFYKCSTFTDKYLVVSTYEGLAIYPVKPILKYHASFQEGRCRLDILIFVMFLDDLFQQGLVLSKNGIEVTQSPLVKIEAVEVPKTSTRETHEDWDRHPRHYVLFMKKNDAYALLKKARLKILKAEVQKTVANEPKVASLNGDKEFGIRPLSVSSLNLLKSLWDRLTLEEQRELSAEYGTSL